MIIWYLDREIGLRRLRLKGAGVEGCGAQAQGIGSSC